MLFYSLKLSTASLGADIAGFQRQAYIFIESIREDVQAPSSHPTIRADGHLRMPLGKTSCRGL
jgi:hypothetical protein